MTMLLVPKEILWILVLLATIQSYCRSVTSFKSASIRKGNLVNVLSRTQQARRHNYNNNFEGQQLKPRVLTSFRLDISSTTRQQQEQDTSPLQIPNEQNVRNETVDVALQPLEQIRKVQRIEKFARLPVWPVLNGVLIWIVGNIFGTDKAAQLENKITGRVCPNFYQYGDTSPYIMLVHHCHTFSTFDPVRYIQRTFFPEGFPAHPHRGFITITYILHGGFTHRDSEGVYQKYGAVESDSISATTGSRDEHPYKGKHTQWLTTGRGMLHEEMFDIPNKFDMTQLNSRQELYQIWLNVPASYKMDEPNSLLIGGDDETPVVYGDDGVSKTLVLAGTYNGQSSIAPILTELVLFHVTLQPGTNWKYNVPSSMYETAFIYMRQGTIRSATGVGSDNESYDDEIVIPVHHTAFFERRGGNTISVTAGSDEVADFMFLAGVPIKEPCYASGSMVMNYPNEIEVAYNDYQKGLFGIPWDYKLSNEDWKIHVKKTSLTGRQQR